MKGLNLSKAASIHNLFVEFLNDDADTLTRPISQLCDLSIKISLLPRSCKIAKVKSPLKKGYKTDPENYHPVLLHSL